MNNQLAISFFKANLKLLLNIIICYCYLLFVFKILVFLGYFTSLFKYMLLFHSKIVLVYSSYSIIRFFVYEDFDSPPRHKGYSINLLFFVARSITKVSQKIVLKLFSRAEGVALQEHQRNTSKYLLCPASS